MIVLTRKPGERVLMPEGHLSVTVLAIEGNRVRLGISAPATVAVFREELWLEIHQPQRDSSVGELVLPESPK